MLKSKQFRGTSCASFMVLLLLLVSACDTGMAPSVSQPVSFVPLDASIALKWKPPVLPLEFAIDSNGNVSATANGEVVTPIGQFSISGTGALDLDPDQIRLIIHNRQDGQDEIHDVQVGTVPVVVDIIGETTLSITNRVIEIDASKAQCIRIREKGIMADLPCGSTSASVYDIISLQPLVPTTQPETNLGLQPGRNTLLDIPFENGWTVTTRNTAQPNLSDQITLSTSIVRPRNVYLLLQAGWGYKQYYGQPVGRVSLRFSSGQDHQVPLIMGVNIRDWARDEPSAVTTFSAVELREAWRGIAPDGRSGGMDMLTVSVPSSYASTILTAIAVTDTSAATAGSENPAIHLLAVTVEHGR